MKLSLHIIYGIIIFVILILCVIGYSYCGSYKNKYQKISDTLNDRNDENIKLVEQVKSLEEELDTTKEELQARISQADTLNSALSDLRRRMGGGTGRTEGQ